MLQASRIADSAFRVIHKTEERGAVLSGPVMFNVEAKLFGEILGGESRPRFLDDNRHAVVIQEVSGAGRVVGIAGRPFVRADVVELDS